MSNESMSRLKEAVAASAVTGITTGPEGEIVMGFRFAGDFVGFSGHFPGYPIVPAIVQILASQLMLSRHLNLSLRLLAVENAKFLAQIRPEQPLSVHGQLRQGHGPMTAEVRIRSEERLAAAFTLRFEPQEAHR